MDNFPQETRKNITDDLNIKFKSMFIDMDLAMHPNSNTPRVRRLHKSLHSQEGFEFSMSHMAVKDDVYEPAMEVLSAHKLLFGGHLLPLQQDPKPQLAQSSTWPKEETCGDKGASFAKHNNNLLNFQFPCESCPLVKLEESHKKCASDKGFLMMCGNEEEFPIQFVSKGSYNPVKYHAREEGFAPESSLHDSIDLLQSCRLDSIFDVFKNDSCSSSFHSRQSSSWSSGEKDSRDSSSSSRCSNGSYQDSCLQGAERKAPHISMLKAKYVNANASAENECDIGVINTNANSNQCCINSGKPPLPTANSRKWSWKGFFTGLRKASKLWADGERGDEGQVSSRGNVQKRPVFTFKELPIALGEPISHQQSAGHHWEWQANTYQFVSNEGSSRKGRLGLGRDDYEEGSVFCLRSGGRQEASLNGSAGGCVKREKGKVQGNAWNAKESWNRCVSKVKQGTRLSIASKGQQKQSSPMQMSNNSNARLGSELEDKRDVYRVMKAKSLSSTPLAKSPVRRPEYNSHNALNGGYGGFYAMQGDASLATSTTSSSSMKNMRKKVGFASCPASMRSSPHNSGLLGVVNKATPDLHTAIQGAIAHCKQSQASNQP